MEHLGITSVHINHGYLLVQVCSSANRHPWQSSIFSPCHFHIFNEEIHMNHVSKRKVLYQETWYLTDHHIAGLVLREISCLLHLFPASRRFAPWHVARESTQGMASRCFHWGIPQEPMRMFVLTIPSGKHTNNYGKSPFLMGKLTISKRVHAATTNNYGLIPTPWTFGSPSDSLSIYCIIPNLKTAKAGFFEMDWWTPKS